MNLVLRLALSATCVGLTGLSAADVVPQDAGTIRILPAKRSTFVPGEPIGLRVEWSNTSSRPIYALEHAEWSVEVRDEKNASLIDSSANVHGRWYYDPPRPGEKVRLPRIAPGKSMTWAWPRLESRFSIKKPGKYTVVFSAKSSFLPAEELVDLQAIEAKDRITMETAPFEFTISEDPIVWGETFGSVRFQVADFGNEVSLIACLLSERATTPYCVDSRVLGALKSKEKMPQPRIYANGMGVQWAGEGGAMFALVRAKVVSLECVVGEGELPAEWPPDEVWKRLEAKYKVDF